MKIQITLILAFFMFCLAPANEALAAAGTAMTAVTTNKVVSKKAAKQEKRQARLEKRLDRMAKFVNRTTGISEAKFKDMSTGARIAIIVSVSVFTVILIFLLLWFLVFKPLFEL